MSAGKSACAPNRADTGVCSYSLSHSKEKMSLSANKIPGKREYHLYSLAMVVILLGWIVVVNYFSNKYFLRLDFSPNQAYTLSQATKQILKDLKEPVLIQAYFSPDLPPVIKDQINQISDLLTEYRIYGRGKVRVEIMDPTGKPGLREELEGRGIMPVPYQVRGASELSLREGFMALEIQYLDQRQAFPNVVAMPDFEYSVSSAILKISGEKEITIALLSGEGMPDAYRDLKSLREIVEKQYQFKTVSTQEGEAIPEDVNVLMVIAPGRISERDKYELDQFLMKGGKIIFLLDGTDVAEEYLVAFPHEDGLDDLLESWGVKRNHDLVMDVVNERVAMRQGPFQMVQDYPLWVKVNIPLLKELGIAENHQIINQLDSIVLLWPSSLEISGKNPEVKSLELLKTTPKSWTQAGGQFVLEPQKLPRAIPIEGMGEKTRVLAYLLEGKFKSFYAGKEKPGLEKPEEEGEKEEPGKKEEKAEAPSVGLAQSPETSILVVGNSRFIKEDYVNIGDSNLNFVLNTIDWMTLGGKLIGVRARISTEKPFSQEVMACLAQGNCQKGSFFRLLIARIAGPFLLPFGIIVYGLVRFQLRRRQKKSWARDSREAEK